MKELLLKLADDLDAIGKESHADMIAALLVKRADTLSDLKDEWADKGFLPHGHPYRKGDDIYQKFRSSSGEIQEVMLPKVSTQESTYRAPPEAVKKPEVAPEPEPAPKPDAPRGWYGEIFRPIEEATSGPAKLPSGPEITSSQIANLLVKMADDLDSIGREAAADEVDLILTKLADKERVWSDKRPAGPGWEKVKTVKHKENGTLWSRDRSAMTWTDWALTGGPEVLGREAEGGIGPDLYYWTGSRGEAEEKSGDKTLPSERGNVPKP